MTPRYRGIFEILARGHRLGRHTRSRDPPDPRHRHRCRRSRLRHRPGRRGAQRHPGVLRDGQGRGEKRPGGPAPDRSANGSSSDPATGSSNWPTRSGPRTTTTCRPSPTGTRRAPRSGPPPSRRNSRPTASARSWRGVTRRCTTARCGSSNWCAGTSTSSYDVIPGITAIQALTARHRIPLNDVGEPVLITTGRQLRATGLAGAAVVMLDADCSFLQCPPSTRIWWGAYLGTPDELLVAGTVGDVGEQISGCAPRPAPGTAGSWTSTYFGCHPVGSAAAWVAIRVGKLSGFTMDRVGHRVARSAPRRSRPTARRTTPREPSHILSAR